MTNYLQLNLKHQKPIFSSHILEKTPEYSGVFFRIFDTNISFCQNLNQPAEKKSLEFLSNYLQLNLKHQKPIDISEGGVFISTRRKKGTGCINKRKNGKFQAVYERKAVGTFASEEEAELALKIHIENL